jgi:hypothetical protein
VFETVITDKQSLKERIVEKISEIDNDMITKVIESIPKRLHKVVESKGAHIETY